MSIITALFALGIATTITGSALALIGAVSSLAPFDDVERDRGLKLLRFSIIAVIVGSFIIGLTAEAVNS